MENHEEMDEEMDEIYPERFMAAVVDPESDPSGRPFWVSADDFFELMHMLHELKLSRCSIDGAEGAHIVEIEAALSEVNELITLPQEMYARPTADDWELLPVDDLPDWEFDYEAATAGKRDDLFKPRSMDTQKH